MLTQEKANYIAYGLMGTCRSIEEIMEMHDLDYYDLSNEEEEILTTRIDAVTFECVVCGWWCDVGDWVDVDTGENVCTQCARDEYGVDDD